MNEHRDNDQFLLLLAEHEAQIFGFLHAIVCHREDSEDLMQQVVVTMWQKFDSFEPGTSFVAWGCKIAKNRALNYFQKRNRRKVFATPIIELLETAAAEQPSAARHARRRALSGCLGKLGSDDRDLILESYGSGGPSIKTVAERMGRPAGSVYNSLRRIRQTLYRCIEATLSQEGHAG